MKIARIVLALFFIVAGANHFLSPNAYGAIMPPYLPWPAQLVAISGAAEIAGGLGVLFPPTRKLAGWCLIALLIVVFPANIQSIVTGVMINGHAVPNWLLWLRLPLQAAFVFWVYRSCLRRTAVEGLRIVQVNLWRRRRICFNNALGQRVPPTISSADRNTNS